MVASEMGVEGDIGAMFTGISTFPLLRCGCHGPGCSFCRPFVFLCLLPLLLFPQRNKTSAFFGLLFLDLFARFPNQIIQLSPTFRHTEWLTT